jgi:hypothetical protein
MTDSNRRTAGMGRRTMLAAMGLAAARSMVAVGRSAAQPSGWPSARLGASTVGEVDNSQFIAVDQFRRWGQALDGIGLRATGSAAHESYVRRLAGELSAAGVSGVRLESVSLRRWLATNWSLRVGHRQLPAAAYVPYSGVTGPAGITGQLVHVGGTDPVSLAALPPLNGKIVVYEVPLTPLPIAVVEALQFPGGLVDPRGELLAAPVYRRPWLNTVPDALQAFKARGAIGSIGVLDLNRRWVAGQYFPYDGIFRQFPSLYVDRATGAGLIDGALSAASATIVLQAQVRPATSSNIVGFIPGMSDEFTVLHTHTDGTNGLEENGQYGILAAAQYLARLPRSALPRTVLILLATGHFYNGLGTLGFLSRHMRDLVPSMTAAITVEHLGALEYLPTSDGDLRATGRHEPGLFFCSGGRALVETDLATLRRADATPGGVARAFLPNPLTAPDNPWQFDPQLAAVTARAKPPLMYPGEGANMYNGANIPDSNYITGPYYLLNAGMPTVDKIDFTRMRALSMALVTQTLALAGASRADIAAPC